MPDQRGLRFRDPVGVFRTAVFYSARTCAVAVLAGVPIVPVVAVRTAPFRHRVVIGPSFEAEPERTGTTGSGRTILRVDRTLEGIVRGHPEQWLWLHRRWPGLREISLERMA
jgi:KDO2-lipid IV(A) lauroyltransferase